MLSDHKRGDLGEGPPRKCPPEHFCQRNKLLLQVIIFRYLVRF